MQVTRVLLLGSLVTVSQSAIEGISRLPDGVVAALPGDLYIGGLFPVHQRDLISGTCADELRTDGLIYYESLRLSLEEINNRSDILPGVKLGAVALDTCSSEKYAVGMALKLMVFKDLLPSSNGKNLNFLAGVIGPHSTSVSIQVANLLSLLSIPQISYGSTSSDISNEAKFPYLLRTVPSDYYLARAIVKLLRSHGWTYVTTIFDDTSYGLAGFRDFEAALKAGGVCNERNYRLNVENPYFYSEEFYLNTISAIEKHQELNVIIACVTPNHLAGLMRATKQLGFGDRFVWIGTDVWGTTPIDTEFWEMLEGSLMITPVLKEFPGLRERFISSILSPDQTKNPWINDLQAAYRNSCRIATVERLTFTNFTLNDTDPNNYTAIEEQADSQCRITEEFLSEKLSEVQFRQAHYVRTAVYTFARALSQLLRRYCGSELGVCRNFRYKLNSHNIMSFSRRLLDELKQAAIAGFEAENGSVTDGRDGPAHYSVLNFQKLTETNYQWVEIGQFKAVNNHSLAYVSISPELYKEKLNFSYPQSHCGVECGDDQVQHFSQQHMCCHTCEPCKFPSVKVNSHNCTLCDHLKFQQPNRWRNACESVQLPNNFDVLNDPLALVILVLCGCGLALEILTVILYMVYLATPIIRASGRELSFVTLLGLLVGLISSGFLILTPTSFNCGFIRFFYGLSYSVCYAAILVKTNRIERIFSTKTNGNKKLKYISPSSQLILVGLLCFVQAAINTIWLLFRFPQTKLRSEVDLLHETVKIYQYCETFEDLEMGVTLIYPAVLLLLCLYYAFRTRKLPGAFSEAKSIFIATHTTFVLWLAFVPIFFALDKVSIRIFVLGMAIIVNANVTLVCMFWPKLYVALWRPEKNTKGLVMGSSTNRGAKETSLGSPRLPESEPLDDRKNHSDELEDFEEMECCRLDKPEQED